MGVQGRTWWVAELKQQLYWFDPAFERAVVNYACTSKRFWARVGFEVDPELLNIPESQWAMRAARQIATDTHAGPGSTTVVLQRLRRWMDDGKIKYDDVLAVGTLFLDAEDDPPVTEDAVAVELAPILKKRIRHKVVLTAMDEAKSADGTEPSFRQAVKLIEKEATLGDEKVADGGVDIDDDAFDKMAATANQPMMSTGIFDLDVILGGGSPRGGVNLWVAATGGGKSMTLIQRLACGMRHGKFCALATLELLIKVQQARLFANLTGIPTNEILRDPPCAKEAFKAIPNKGTCRMQSFPSYATTAKDVFAWVDVIEQEEGAKRGVERVPLDLLVIDYADLLSVPSTVGKDADSGYAVGMHVYSALRVYAEGENKPGDGGHPGGPIWIDTASAATRNTEKRKRIRSDDVADSLHKSRRATLIVSINPVGEDGADGSDFYVSKNTYGPDTFKVGPLPHEKECARIAPVVVP